jgi:Fe-S cluster assembly ATPase SufC
MRAGVIVEEGGPELAETLERDGYAKYGAADSARIGLDLQ